MKQSVAILGSALLLATPLAADTNVVTTDPVGVMRYVFQANSDTAMSLPLHRPTEFAGAVGSVGSNWITAFATSNSPINWANNDWTYGVGTNANNTYYAMFTTGALEGAWFQITGNNSNTLFLDTAGFASLATAGVVASNNFEIIPFWTLSTVFPGGTGIVASVNPFAPGSIVFFNNESSAGINLAPSSGYFFYDGSAGMIAAGWYPVGNPFVPKLDDLALTPDSFYRIRQPNTQSTNFVTGAVAMNDFSTFLSRLGDNLPQDNFVGFGFPVDTSLAGSGLQNSPGFTQSSDLFSPKDIVLIFDQTSAGINKAPKKGYYFYDGTGGFPAGWYEVGNPFSGTQDTNLVIAAGSGIIVRKFTGTKTSAQWTATPNYSP